MARRLGLVYKEEILKRLNPRHTYSFLHKTFQEHLATSYIAFNLRSSVFQVLDEQVKFYDVKDKFRRVFLFVCGIMREEASILFTQIGGTLQKDWDWSRCRGDAGSFFTESWKESGNSERMANVLCSFLPFPRVLHVVSEDQCEGFIDVLEAYAGFSKVQTPEVHVAARSFKFIWRVLARVPNVKTIVLPAISYGDCFDRAEVDELLRASKTLEKVTYTLLAGRSEGWAKSLNVGFGADSSL